ncbi:response regulator [Spirobacillus cienkowskii]|uniref:response regulator n=1 Tax=Spirobacillus cienkowskii TaxID=495820 RepID=UPI0030CC9AA8
MSESNTEEKENLERKNITPEEKKKILYIDDDEISQKIITKALSRYFNVTSELSGTNAMLIADQINPHLILLDLNMPNVDGFEILHHFRQHPTLSSIPIICVSGDKDEHTRRRANELGATKYMPKPIDITQVSTDVKNLLNILNTTLKSQNNKIKILIGFNTSEKDILIKKDILELFNNGENILILSIQEGKVFFKNFNISNDSFELGRIIYLQIKASLIARLPYLEELSSVIFDLRRMLNFDIDSYHLIFDSPEVLFNIQEISQSNSSLILISNTLSQHFKTINYYTKSNKKNIENINTMAKILVGNF